MGEIGKTLPKVMWPIFEKSLLELQVRFAKRLGYDKIYINLFHQADEILAQTKNCKTFDDVTWLRESPNILDIGGGIHNLARRPEVGYEGELLVLNADQFLWFSKQDLELWKNQAGDFDGLLLTWLVNTTQGYNQVKSDESRRFLGVVPNASLPRDTLIETYSGNSLINLARLQPTEGVSAFFDSVAPPKSKIITAKIEAKNYWDFGTARRYFDSMFRILKFVAKKNEDEFISFLRDEGSLRVEKIDLHKLSYSSDCEEVINLSSCPISGKLTSSIVLRSEREVLTCGEKLIIYKDINQALS